MQSTFSLKWILLTFPKIIQGCYPVLSLKFFVSRQCLASWLWEDLPPLLSAWFIYDFCPATHTIRYLSLPPFLRLKSRLKSPHLESWWLAMFFFIITINNQTGNLLHVKQMLLPLSYSPPPNDCCKTWTQFAREFSCAVFHWREWAGGFPVDCVLFLTLIAKSSA